MNTGTNKLFEQIRKISTLPIIANFMVGTDRCTYLTLKVVESGSEQTCIGFDLGGAVKYAGILVWTCATTAAEVPTFRRHFGYTEANSELGVRLLAGRGFVVAFSSEKARGSLSMLLLLVLLLLVVLLAGESVSVDMVPIFKILLELFRVGDTAVFETSSFSGVPRPATCSGEDRSNGPCTRHNAARSSSPRPHSISSGELSTAPFRAEPSGVVIDVDAILGCCFSEVIDCVCLSVLL
jgi:hypothetical protein